MSQFVNSLVWGVPQIILVSFFGILFIETVYKSKQKFMYDPNFTDIVRDTGFYVLLAYLGGIFTKIDVPQIILIAFLAGLFLLSVKHRGTEGKYSPIGLLVVLFTICLVFWYAGFWDGKTLPHFKL